MNKRIILCAFISISHFSLVAQELNFANFSLSADLEFKQLYSSTLSLPPEFRVDPQMQKLRWHDSSKYYSPFMHNAIYFKLGVLLEYKNKYRLSFTPYFEQRGWSVGIINNDNNLLYNFFSIEVQDTIHIKQNDLTVDAKMGNYYEEEERFTGLRAYNIDMQGLYSSLSYKRNRMLFTYAGDLIENIGLLIDEYFYFHYLREVNGNSNTELGATFNIIRHRPRRFLDHQIYCSYGLTFHHIFSDNLEINLIADYADRKLPNPQEKYANLGGLLELNYKYNAKRIKLNLSAGYRYFGYNYLKNHYETFFRNDYFRYRSIIYGQDFPNDKGPMLYPLKNYFRPVSQFALYSEYQPENNMTGIEFSACWEQQLSKKIGNKADLELLNIHKNIHNYNNYYFYYYYTNFIYYEMFPGFKGGLYVTNKLMNLDVQYQTFYQSRHPFFGFHFTWDGVVKIKE